MKETKGKTEKVEVFEIKVGGQYRFGDRRNLDLAEFEETFTLPFTGGEALSQIRKKLIEPRLKSTKKQYRGVRTCRILDVKETTGSLLNQKDIPKMNFGDLTQFSAENKLIAIPERTSNIEEARDIVLAELQRKAKVAKKPTTKLNGPQKAEMMGDRGMEFDEIVD